MSTITKILTFIGIIFMKTQKYWQYLFRILRNSGEAFLFITENVKSHNIEAIFHANTGQDIANM